MRSSPFLKALDAAEIESRFSNDDAILYQDMVESNVSYDEIRPFLNKLPTREVDLLELYYCERKNQKDIAKIFGVTQGAISSRLARAQTRLVFLRNLPKISEDELDGRLNKYFSRLELEIIKTMLKTTCQSKTAELINQRFGLKDEKNRMTQVKVRHRFEKCLLFLKKQKDKEPDLSRYCHLLEYIKKNLYKLHEVKLPHFDRGASTVFSLTI